MALADKLGEDLVRLAAATEGAVELLAEHGDAQSDALLVDHLGQVTLSDPARRQRLIRALSRFARHLSRTDAARLSRLQSAARQPACPLELVWALGLEALRTQDWESAEELLAHAEADPHHWDLVGVERARVALERSRPAEAEVFLRRAVSAAKTREDFERLHQAARLLQSLQATHTPAAKRQVRIAYLSSSTGQFVPALLKLACFRDHMAAEVFAAPFGQWRQMVFEASSRLAGFAPEVVILALNHRDAGAPPNPAVADELINWWSRCRDQFSAHVIVHNFDLPPDQPMGNLAGVLPDGSARLLRAINERLAEAASKATGVSLLDYDLLAGSFGKRQWDDPGLWHLAKQTPPLAALPMLIDRYMAVIRGVLGLSRKVLVLDLDGTLWGGVVGEDGVANIKIGPGDAVGEAHWALQQYAKSLRQRGVVLAVCSKNNEPDALEPFDKRPEMPLKREDFAVFCANWQDKASNLAMIAERLNLGVDSLVFVDDSPAERTWVRQNQPEVAVPELPEDPAGFVRAIDQHGYFEAISLTEEDRRRADEYQAEAARQTMQASVADMASFLAGLDMRAVYAGFDELHLPRIVQLINKTNQWNLTTRRYTEPQVRAMMADDRCHTAYLKLRDRFGDSGLIALWIAFRRDDQQALWIDTWLMSCRVIGRGVENLLLRHAMELARRHGLEQIVGEYLPTAKNVLVKDLYASLGFTLQSSGEDGSSTWSLEVSDSTRLPRSFIQLETPSRKGRS